MDSNPLPGNDMLRVIVLHYLELYTFHIGMFSISVRPSLGLALCRTPSLNLLGT